MRRQPSVLLACIAFFALLVLPAHAAAPVKDPHHTDAGFFDIHVCNWPDQPLFLMGLFSTTQYRDIASIELFAPNGSTMGPLDLTRYRPVIQPDKTEKRVIMAHFAIPEKHSEGWYHLRITMKNGRILEASDHVVLKVLPFAKGQQPAAGSENIPMPSELRWDPVPGAAFYQVYLRDEWESERYLLVSRIIKDTFIKIPPGLLKPGGSYTWRIHARNIDGDPEWGDFNHGSLAKEIDFTIAH